MIVAALAGSADAAVVVSLTFDDGQSTQYQAREPLRANGMNATFFVNSGIVPTEDGYWRMPWWRLKDLAADGNEVTGHGLTHADLTTLSSDQLRQEVCQDRTNLLNQGFSGVTSFAYPYAAYNATVQSMVRECGYTAARAAGGIRSVGGCGSCPFAETLPPRDAFALRTPDFYGATISLSTMQQYVTQAEQNGGGWVILGFHEICDSCSTGSATVKLADLTAFLEWLKPRASFGTTVKTVGAVMGGGSPPPTEPTTPPPADTTAPKTTIACNGSSCGNGWYRGTVGVTLSATDTGGSGLKETRYTLDGTEPTRSTGLIYSGPLSLQKTTTVRFRSIDNAGNMEPTQSQRVKIR